MNALAREMQAVIAEQGPISLERFMALALSHPRHGYYATREAIGAAGDFVTAPEISQMFGELIGLWAIEVWQAMGAPNPLRLVELGPGRGTLMQDVLRAARIAPAFRAALDVHLVETSPWLAAAQRDLLADAGVPIAWHDSFDSVPPGAAIVLANEFFDALPVRHFVHDGGGWRERLVGLGAGGTLVFGLAAEAEPQMKVQAREGDVLELAPAAQAQMRRIATRLVEQGGACLAIDYGHVRTRTGETLQAVKRHAYADPLEDPGEADLTAHVDFAALARTAQAAGAFVHGPAAQGDWLRRLGILARAADLKRNAAPAQAAAVDAALARLTGPSRKGDPNGGMGELFKVIAVTQTMTPPPPGFDLKGTP